MRARPDRLRGPAPFGTVERCRPSRLALAVDIGGTKLEVGLVDDGRRACWPASGCPPGGDGGPEELFDSLAGPVAAVLGPARPAGAPDPVVCGVGTGGPMSVGGEEVSPINIPAWRRFPLRRRLRSSPGLPTYVDNDAKALALGEGWTGAARGQRRLPGHGGQHRGGRRHRGRRAPPRRRRRATPGTSATCAWSPTGERCGCGARGCLEAEASGTAIAATTGRPAAGGAAPRSSPARGPSSAGRWPRWRTCSTCAWRWSPARWRSGSGSRSSTPPRPRSTAGPGSTSRPAPASGRAAWAPTAPSSARRRWAGGVWVRGLVG